MVSVIIAAGGKGRRMGADKNKVFLDLNGKEILAHTISAFEKNENTDEIIIVTADEDIKTVENIICREGFKKITAVTEGGKERQDSVYNGLICAKGEYVVIHDGARCLITDENITAVINDAKKYGAASLGVKVKDTLKTVDENGMIISTVDREKTVHIQTPQVFLREEIMDLHKKIKENGIAVTDDCSVFEHFGKKVYVTEGSYDNIKLTTPEDIITGCEILRKREELSERE